MIDYSNIPRDSRRVPIETRVQFTFDRFTGFLNEYSCNISPGGMFIKTLKPLPPGQILDFEFDLGDGFELINGRGEVVWVLAQDEGPMRPAGMGLRFLELSEGSKDLIYRMVDQHILQGGTPFDVSQIPPPPLAQPDLDATDASLWLPVLDDKAAQPTAVLTPAAPVPQVPAPAPAFSSVFGSASSRRSAPSLPWPWIAAAVLVLGLGAAGFLYKDTLLGLIGLGGGEEAAQAPSPTRPTAQPAPAPRREEAAPEPAPEETAPPVAEASPATAPEEPTAAPAPAGPPLTALERITWEEAFGGTDVILQGNGAIPSSLYTRTRIDGNPPRELIRIQGVLRPFSTPRLRVGTAEVLQIRSGYHPDKGNEQHIVLDLSHPTVRVTRVEEAGNQLRIHLQRE